MHTETKPKFRDYYKIPGLKVSSDGKTIIRWYKDDTKALVKPRPPKYMKIRPDKDGNLVIKPREGEFRVDELVATCFCHCPGPRDDYEVVHKNGNKMNCSKENLEWRKKVPHVSLISTCTQPNKVTLSHGISIHKDGKVTQNGKTLSVRYSIYDGDVDLERAIEPSITYEYKNKWKRIEKSSISMDKLMGKVGYVSGEASNMKSPRILHKDHNYRNFDSSNLEWCEEDDPKYQGYLRQKKDDMNTLNKSRNKNFPDTFLIK